MKYFVCHNHSFFFFADWCSCISKHRLGTQKCMFVAVALAICATSRKKQYHIQRREKWSLHIITYSEPSRGACDEGIVWGAYHVLRTNTTIYCERQDVFHFCQLDLPFSYKKDEAFSMIKQTQIKEWFIKDKDKHCSSSNFTLIFLS